MTREEEEIAFFYELGLAVSQWSFIESGVYGVVAACIEAADYYGVGVALFALDSFRAKLAFSNALLEKKITNKTHFKVWVSLEDRLRKASYKRNRLVHYRVYSYRHNNAGRRLALERFPPPEGHKLKPTGGDLCVRNITAIRYEFFQLFLALENFEAILLGRPKPHPIVDALPKNPPTIRTINNQIHAALGHQRAPSRQKSSN
jgi:hypothetical protein